MNLQDKMSQNISNIRSITKSCVYNVIVLSNDYIYEKLSFNVLKMLNLDVFKHQKQEIHKDNKFICPTFIFSSAIQKLVLFFEKLKDFNIQKRQSKLGYKLFVLFINNHKGGGVMKKTQENVVEYLIYPGLSQTLVPYDQTQSQMTVT